MQNNNKKPKKILVVEDDPISQRVAELTLQNLGYEVDLANNGKEALTLFQLNHYVAILMDLGLADMTGDQITRKMRALENHNEHTPIIALTAHLLPSDKGLCLAAGMDDFLVKPLDMQTMRKVLARWIASA